MSSQFAATRALFTGALPHERVAFTLLREPTPLDIVNAIGDFEALHSTRDRHQLRFRYSLTPSFRLVAPDDLRPARISYGLRDGATLTVPYIREIELVGLFLIVRFTQEEAVRVHERPHVPDMTVLTINHVVARFLNGRRIPRGVSVVV